ncbi:hypothetical protein J7L02_02615 [Candidatus Woesearchaeota archaeon]|nr:hypothetical protein [Candidatus Woesearchaeota archaeon]
MKTVFAVLLALVLALSFASIARAASLQVEYTKINGEIVDDLTSLEIKRGEELNIKIGVTAIGGNVDNAQIEAAIYGYKYGYREREIVSDVTKTFDLAENDTTFKTLKIEIPTDMDKKYTKLRIIVADENGVAYIKDYQLHVVGVDVEDSVVIKDFSFSPEEVRAGRWFTALVKVKNIGEEDLDFVKVTVKVPELHIQASEYLDELEADDSQTFEELLLRLPDCAEPGVYNVDVIVNFDKYGEVKTTGQITVLENPACVEEEEQPAEEGKTIVTVPGPQTAMPGQEVAYPIIIKNQGKTSKSYSLAVKDIDWASYRFEPGAALVVQPGKTQTVYLYITPNKDVQGTKAFTVQISTDSEAQDVILSANVQAVEKQPLRTLEIILVLLVLLLVLIGILLAYKRTRTAETESEEYY